MNRIIVTGCLGRIGRPLINNLLKLKNEENIVGCDIRGIGDGDKELPPIQFHQFDLLDEFDKLQNLVESFKPDTIIHLADISSLKSESQPLLPSIHFNNYSVENLLELSRLKGIKIFVPSSITAFGPESGKRRVRNTQVVMRPRFSYGICRLYGELLGEYYNYRYGVDFRSIRLPGIISHESEINNSNGISCITDYATSMINYALEQNKKEKKEENYNPPFICPVDKNARLPMIHVMDAVQAIIKLLNVDRQRLKTLVYNVQGLSLSPIMLKKTLESALKNPINIEWRSKDKKIKSELFDNYYSNLPQSLDDRMARRDWKWNPKFNTALKLVSDFIINKNYNK